MKTSIWIVVVLLVAVMLAGCQDVTLRGQAMTVAENSALMSHEAHARFVKQNGTPEWTGKFLEQNAKQWKFFVRAAKKNQAWGKELDK